jgi:uncharacterized protein DUF4252
MRFATILLCGGLALASAAGAAGLRDNAAYLDFQAMGFFDESDLSVNVNVEAPLLRLLAALDGHDREASEVLGKLDAVQVRVLPLSGEDRTADLLHKVDELSRKLDASGWDHIVRVRERNERVEVYLQHDGTAVSGLAVLAIDPQEEAVFVNLVGDIDLKHLGSIGRHLHIDSDAKTGLDSLSDIDKEIDRLKELRKQRSDTEN